MSNLNKICLGYMMLGILLTLAIISLITYAKLENLYILDHQEKEMVLWSRLQKNRIVVIMGTKDGGSMKKYLKTDNKEYVTLRRLMASDDLKENIFLSFPMEDSFLKYRSKIHEVLNVKETSK